jgi:murein tripeptide amidase MpaA
LTARVHPGESPASFVLNGIINFILNESSEQARMIREKFVFKIIPILNPDGVYRGYYRHDTRNYNLNRYYSDPTPEAQPTIWATKQAIILAHNTPEGLFTYVDIHAHANKMGCFMFGNALDGE